MPQGIFVDDRRYDALVQALLNLPPCAVTGEVTDNEIKVALGEVGNIWPASILPLLEEDEPNNPDNRQIAGGELPAIVEVC